MESSGISVILPNIVEFVPMLIAFIIVAIILGKFGWPKFDAMLEKRKSSIENALKESEEKRVEAEKLANEYKEKLATAQQQANQILKDAKLSGIQIGKEIEDAAKEHANATTQKAQLFVEQQKRSAEHDIKTQAVDIAFSAIKKFISNDMTDEEHRKLIEKYVNEAGSLNA